MFQTTKQKREAYIVFSVYFMLLIWLVLFKFATSLSEIPRMRSINLIPFFYAQATNIQKKEILYNIIIFIPLGLYLHILKEEWKITTKCLSILGISFLFEVVQFVFAIGASDITDLIGNTFGGICGIILCIIMKKIAPKKFISVINGCGTLIEIVAIGLFLFIWFLNIDFLC